MMNGANTSTICQLLSQYYLVVMVSSHKNTMLTVIEMIFVGDCSYDGNALLSCIEVYNQQPESWELLERGMTTQRCDAGLTVVHLR